MLARFSAMKKHRGSIIGSAWLLACLLTGCQNTAPQTRTDPAPAPPPAGADMVIRSGRIEEPPKNPAVTTVPYKSALVMADAEQYYREENYKEAAKLFGKVADEKHNPPHIAEKARFFEAECQRMQFRYPDAATTFNRLLNDFERGIYREKAVGRIFEICNYWLDDTRKQMDAEKAKLDGKSVSVPWNFVHFDKTKPLLDEEGHALKMLEAVYANDPTGPYAERALYLAGYVQFHRLNFKAADNLLTTLINMDDKNGKKSKYRDDAIQLCILAKNNSVGGPDYDPRKSIEALQLIHQTKVTSTDLTPERNEFLNNQQIMIRYMQAEKDFNIGEFYLRTGHPASAWFYYELVRRRYQGSEFHDKAIARMTEIRGDLAEQQQQTELARATRRTWNKWAFGRDTPTLSEGKEVPALPGQLPERGNGQLLPVSGTAPMPAELNPMK